MQGRDPVQADEILLHRVPPWPNQTKQTDEGIRPTGFAFQPRKGDPAVSFSRLGLTSPRELLDQLTEHQADRDEWMVAAVRAGDVQAIGFAIDPKPEPSDEGHCHVRVPADAKLGKKCWSKLAARSRLLTADEIDSGTVEVWEN